MKALLKMVVELTLGYLIKFVANFSKDLIEKYKRNKEIKEVIKRQKDAKTKEDKIAAIRRGHSKLK